jgi:hypothetical protein
MIRNIYFTLVVVETITGLVEAQVNPFFIVGLCDVGFLVFSKNPNCSLLHSTPVYCSDNGPLHWYFIKGFTLSEGDSLPVPIFAQE